MGRVQDKVAIVTGGASGLGAATARLLAHEGAKVVITDIQEQAGQALARDIGCDFIRQDVAEEARWQQVVDEVASKHGGLHILVNNAGYEGPLDAASPENTRLSDWQRVHRVNVEGVFLGCRAAIPVMRTSGGGSIINMSSIAALVATPFITAYGASKAAVRQFTMSVALHCAQDGSRVRCNSVHPGQIRTPMLEKLFRDTAAAQGTTLSEAEAAFLARVPMGEFGAPADVAYAVLFLASDEAKHVTGTQIVVDGGMEII